MLAILAPVVLFSQTAIPEASGDSTYILMFNVSTVFYTAKDVRINNFLNKYGYAAPGNVPTGLRFELAGMPAGHKMMYSINAGTIISRQDIRSADISLGVYRRFFETRHSWLVAGVSLGEHFDRVVLNGRLPPTLDSLSLKYAPLSLHRTGLIAEPALKYFWYPLKTRRYQLGLYSGVYYDFDFNSRWRVGYYPHGGNSFKNLRKPTSVSTVQEFGWVFSTGISVCF